MTTESEPVSPDIDWSLTTFEGVRREQLRRWARLPLEDVIRSLEEMEQLARMLHGGAAPRGTARRRP